MQRRTPLPVLAASVLALCAAGLALAQDVAPGGDEIIVTARKREETLQDVPLSIAALTSEQLQGRGLNSDYDIANFTVGFRTLEQTGRDIDRPTIRGMGAPVSRGEPNASYFIDGTFVSGSISTATTSAVERVEVLRGPQSAQFGRATFSGAVNYVTRKPTDTFQGQVNTRAGTSDDYNVGGWASGPLVNDKLLFLVSGNWSKYGGQWHNHLEDGQASYEKDSTLPFRQFLLNPPQEGDHSRLGAEETTDALGKLVWRPGEGSEVTVKYGYTKGEDSHFASLIAAELNCYLPVPGTENEPWYGTSTGWYCGEFRAEGRVNRINLPDFRNGVTFIGANAFENPADYTVPPTEPGTFREQNRVLLEYVQDLGGFTVTSRGSWNRDDFQQVFDLDHTENRSLWGLFHFDNQRVIEDRSAELRLDTPADRPLRGSIGVYWYDQDRENRQRSFVGPGVVFGAPETTTAFPPSTFLDVTNEAVYGSVDWDFAERWTLTLEGRYAQDSKDLSGGALTGPELPATVGLDFDSFTPRVTVRFRPTADLTLYALAAKGNKPGEFNTEFFRAGIDPVAVDAGLNGCTAPPEPQPPPVIPCLGEPLAVVKEEEQWTYELGAKASWFDRRLSTNLAVYHIDWQNQGLFTTVNILQTAGTYLTTTIIRNAGESRVDGLELETSFRVTDRLSVLASYGYTDSRYEKGSDTVLAELTGDGDLHGKKVPNVPRHTLILGGYAMAPITDGADAFLNVDYSYSTKRYTAANNFSWLGDDLTVNLRAGVELASWTFTAYVRNLTNDDTPLAALDFVNFGTVDVNYAVNDYGNIPATAGPNDDRDPRIFSLSPKRGRDWGLEVQYRF
jgi:outer membrane receptor protein involved in Fe transport